jgi:hypothetical protein
MQALRRDILAEVIWSLGPPEAGRYSRT